MPAFRGSEKQRHSQPCSEMSKAGLCQEVAAQPGGQDGGRYPPIAPGFMRLIDEEIQQDCPKHPDYRCREYHLAEPGRDEEVMRELSQYCCPRQVSEVKPQRHRKRAAPVDESSGQRDPGCCLAQQRVS